MRMSRRRLVRQIEGLYPYYSGLGETRWKTAVETFHIGRRRNVHCSVEADVGVGPSSREIGPSSWAAEGVRSRVATVLSPDRKSRRSMVPPTFWSGLMVIRGSLVTGRILSLTRGRRQEYFGSPPWRKFEVVTGVFRYLEGRIWSTRPWEYWQGPTVSPTYASPTKINSRGNLEKVCPAGGFPRRRSRDRKSEG